MPGSCATAATYRVIHRTVSNTPKHVANRRINEEAVSPLRFADEVRSNQHVLSKPICFGDNDGECAVRAMLL
jgi:hypothetical protein